MDISKDFVITIDVDWAPDFAIDFTSQLLIKNNVRATWFVTHESPAVERLRSHLELFELGIHPNLLPGSTHGANEDEVLSHLQRLVPNAACMRTHGLYQSSSFLIKANTKFGIKADLSLLLPRAANLVPHKIKWSGANLWRFPYFWE